MNAGSLTAIDLCSGPGGVTAGYKAAGVRVLAAVDIDESARETYATNHPEVELLSDNLAQLEPNRILEMTGLKPGELGILTACVPCQTFSSLGPKSKRKNDPRNKLVGRVADFVAVLLPRAVVMENVPRLMRDRRLALLRGRLRKLGYGVWCGIVDAADFGVPQRRRRLVLIALKGVEDKQVPELKPGHPALRGTTRRTTVRQTFRRLRRNGQRGDPLARPRQEYPSLVARRIAAIPYGGGRRDLPSDLELECHVRVGKSGASSAYGRMRYDEVAPTLTTRCTTPACGRFLHPRANRPITLREAACLQTFPLNYEFEGGTMAIQAQIGNAVPPKLARAIARVVSYALAETNVSGRSRLGRLMRRKYAASLPSDQDRTLHSHNVRTCHPSVLRRRAFL